MLMICFALANKLLKNQINPTDAALILLIFGILDAFLFIPVVLGLGSLLTK